MKAVACLGLVTLAGCAMSPLELREGGKREEFASTRLPRQAAECVMRSAENYRPGIADPFPANWREGEKPGTFEVLVRNPVFSGHMVMLVEIAPAKTGSHITTWLSPHIAYQSMSERVVERCDAVRIGPAPVQEPTRGRDDR